MVPYHTLVNIVAGRPMSTLRNLVHWLLRTPQAPRAVRAPLTEYAQKVARAERVVITADEYQRRYLDKHRK